MPASAARTRSRSSTSWPAANSPVTAAFGGPGRIDGQVAARDGGLVQRRARRRRRASRPDPRRRRSAGRRLIGAQPASVPRNWAAGRSGRSPAVQRSQPERRSALVQHQSPSASSNPRAAPAAPVASGPATGIGNSALGQPQPGAWSTLGAAPGSAARSPSSGETVYGGDAPWRCRRPGPGRWARRADHARRVPGRPGRSAAARRGCASRTMPAAATSRASAGAVAPVPAAGAGRAAPPRAPTRAASRSTPAHLLVHRRLGDLPVAYRRHQRVAPRAAGPGIARSRPAARGGHGVARGEPVGDRPRRRSPTPPSAARSAAACSVMVMPLTLL